MHHYRCQNVYISATASERIVDTLEFFPHNSPMPQLSSTDRLIMAANNMTNALKNPHPAVPFAQVGDDTLPALAQLAEILKNKFQKVKAPELSNAPIKAAKNKRHAAMAQPILNYPMQHKHQKISQTTINTEETTNKPLLPRVITPMMGQAAPLRVPTLSQKLSPRNLSQDDFWNIETANIAVALGTNHWSQQHFSNAVAHNWQVNGIHGPHERPRPSTTLEAGFWQQGRPPFSRHPRHPRNRHMFLCGTSKHPKRQKNNMREDIL
jgi:hypothetical protein